MTTPEPNAARGWGRGAAAVAVAAIVALVAVVYARSIGGTFTLDDSHSIQSNPWVRSLAHIPTYFTDPSTFSTLSTNVDYRPVLQTTYAINYALSGYDTWSWNLFNVAIHAAVCVGIFLLGRVLMGDGRLAPLPGVSAREGDAISLAAAGLVAVHPVFSGAVNYISARSTTLTAALMLAVLVLYLRRMTGRGGLASLLVGLVLYALAMLTKIEAVALVGVLFAAEVLLSPQTRAWPLVRRVFAVEWLLRLWPVLLLTLAGLWWWSRHTALIDSSTRADAGMTAMKYLATQVHAWWYYAGQLVAPVNLMLENLTYPRSEGFAEPLPLLAIAGWVLVGAGLLACARRAPAITLLGLSYFMVMAPTSSVVPLAEMVNEHRPYLPLALVTLIASAGLYLAGRWATGRGPLALACAAGVLGVPLALLTQERHEAWSTPLSLLHDNAEKCAGARVQMNYGLALQGAGDRAGALRRLRAAAESAPGYALARINLGLALAREGRAQEARAELDAGVNLSPRAEATRYWRGRQRLLWGEAEAAIEDFRVAVEAAPASLAARAALIEALIEAGRNDEAASLAAVVNPDLAPLLDQERAAFRTAMGPAWNRASDAARAELSAGLEHMAAARYADARARFNAALTLAPNWVYPVINLAIAEAGAGDDAAAAAAFDRARAIAPSSPDVAFFTARWQAQRRRYEPAAAGFREALRLGREPGETTAHLVVVLRAMGDERGAVETEAALPAAARPAFEAALPGAQGMIPR